MNGHINYEDRSNHVIEGYEVSQNAASATFARSLQCSGTSPILTESQLSDVALIRTNRRRRRRRRRHQAS